MKAILLISCLIISPVLFSQNGKTPVKVTDMLKIKSISGVTLNKEGSKAAFTVTAIEPDGDTKWEYKYVNQVWMVSTDGNSVPKQLTTREGSSQADWSPDGKQLAFVRLADGKPQIFILSLDGGEALQLTKFKYGAGSPQWSPDGKQILFSSNINIKELLKDSILNPNKEIPKWPIEKPGFAKNEQFISSSAKADPDGNIYEIRSYLDNNVTDKKAKVIDKLNFQDEMDASAEMSVNHYFTIETKADAKPVEITKGFYSFNRADFTPDGKQIIISGDVDSLQHPDRSQENEIFIADADGNNFHLLLGE
ncbi:MAG: DPP IV N-terminal domain-containing protein, partial [Flavobacterium sp.]